MNQKINCIIVDDNPTAIDVLRANISEFPNLVLGKTYTKPIVALSELMVAPDGLLIFMDIDMPALSGLSLADSLKGKSHNIIFTTSYSDYAIQAFKVRAKHYLVKPFNFTEFAKALSDVVIECYTSHNIEKESSDAFYLREAGDRSTVIKVLKKDIIHMQGSNNHLHIYLENGNYSVYLTIAEMAEKVATDPRFYRVHKSHILNTDFIRTIVGNKIDLGKYEVIMASHYKNDFLDHVQRNFLKSRRS